MKTELKKNPFAPGYKILVVDGLQKNCPFQQPIPMPGKIQGSMQLFQQPCGTHCPLFGLNFYDDRKETDVVLACGGNPIEYQNAIIEPTKEQTQGPKLVID